MLRGIEKLRAELDRVRRPRTATLTPTPGGDPVEVAVGDELEIVYGGEARRVRILAVAAWGVRCWDVGKSAVRAFRFEKIGSAGGQAQGSDGAASG